MRVAFLFSYTRSRSAVPKTTTTMLERSPGSRRSVRFREPLPTVLISATTR